MASMKKFLSDRISPETYHSLSQAKHALINRYALKTFSQSGEDLILRQILGDRPTGFYVDVGAHHPKRYSNTYYFYSRGWRGINIDAMPGSMKAFQKSRPRDINLEIGISETEGELTFYVFNEPALNTFDSEVAKQNNKEPFKLVDEVKVKTLTLASALNQHLPSGLPIDFLSVDVEGLDLKVLKSNDWTKYCPEIVLVESHTFDMDSPQSNEVYCCLHSRGYKAVAKTTMTLIFQR